ncbi:repeat protein [Catonella morbi ATCC 51271]|uniref:Repeat protein n=1 Tax=Catonella morbi ATCC 51271 TaxID=592026 RepID=V2Y444_9FIRM|nr:InlB B-repeat-containing protein [Catonella morbi]ESL02862.1 repeat protein [Catonella morbi ATCC 51271]
MMKIKSKFNGRFLSILLTLVMCLTLLPMTVFAEGGEPEEIKEVVATAEIEVPKLGYKPGNPKFTIISPTDKGVKIPPAQIYWLKKDDNGMFKPYFGSTFEEGRYRLGVQVRSEKNDGKYYPLSEYVTFKVNGDKWFSEKIWQYSDYSCVNCYGAEYVVTYSGEQPEEIFTVAFDTKGGTPSINPQKVKKGQKADEPADPYLFGYEFGGWYTEKECTNKFNFNTPITENITLYAKWTVKAPVEKFVVSFDKNGHGSGASITPRIVEKGKTVEEPLAPKDEGFEFGGWYTEKKCIHKFDFNTPIAENITLYAKWTEKTPEIIEIDTVDITVANLPVVGGEPTTNGITVNTEGLNFSFAKNYLVKDSKYYTIGSDRIYEAGKEYAIGVTMLLKENYKFAKDIIVNVNNNKAKIDNCDINILSIVYSFGVLQGKPKTFNVKISDSISNGKVTADKTSGIYAKSKVSLTVTPDDGYKLDKLEVVKNISDQKVTVDEYNTFEMPGSDVTITATFKEITQTAEEYNIKVIPSENGTVTPDKEKAKEGEVVKLTFDPAEGYEIDSIEVTDGSGEKIELNNATFRMPASDVTVTATFKKAEQTPVEYKITVNEPENGTVTSDRKTAKKDEIVTLTAKPNEGYDLDKLTVKDKDGQEVNVGEGNTFIMPASDVTVTATFKKAAVIYTVKFETNGGMPEPAEQKIEEGKKADKPADPAKEGYKFVDWYTEAECINRFDFATPISQNITLYARYVPVETQTYTVTFDSNGGTEVPPQTVLEGEKAIKPADPTTLSDEFDGWYIDKNFDKEFDFNTPISGDITLYAKWVPWQHFKVTFDLRGHGAQLKVQKVGVGEKAKKPNPDPAADGWKFEGWYTTAECVIPFNFGTEIMSDTTIYAKWTKVESGGDYSGPVVPIQSPVEENKHEETTVTEETPPLSPTNTEIVEDTTPLGDTDDEEIGVADYDEEDEETETDGTSDEAKPVVTDVKEETTPLGTRLPVTGGSFGIIYILIGFALSVFGLKKLKER